MAHLTLVGRDDDGTRLVLVSDKGVEFTLDIDSPLVAALRETPGDETDRHGKLEIQMDSTLRPRDIQARIRAGESAEEVARAAQSTVEKVMPFAAPVLAERAHMAQRAQASSVRRRAGDSGARTLGEAVASRLRPLNVDPAVVEWDAWRREDGRWTLVGAYSTGARTGTATFSYDHRGNFVTLDDDDARWLVGDHVDEPAPPAAPPESEPATPGRRLSAVPADPQQLVLGDDALTMVGEEPVEEADPSAETTEIAVTDPAAETPRETDADDRSEPDSEPEAAPEPRRGRGRRGRSSVPSWDEIMFGGGKQE